VNTEVLRCLWILVDVQLREPNVFALAGELLDDRPDHAARTAPRRPEVDHRRPLRDLFSEIGVADGYRMAVSITSRVERRFAFGADSFLARRKLPNSIGLSTGRTPDDFVHAVLQCESEAIIAA
jgi:hypothetical protein